jgi:nitroimidazol reductase NimA-like FMN-containing flavoprotein (pyridoxamine 5'-phosphate oxidase superfamily)
VPLPRSILRLTEEELEELLTTERSLRIGTVNKDGTPHVAPLWFVWHDGAIWINSLRRSRRTTDLASGSTVALCIDAGHDYAELRGAVLYGTPEEITDEARTTEARKLFGKKYWNIDEIPVAKSHTWLRVKPDKIVSWDFKKIPTGKDPKLDAQTQIKGERGPTGEPRG